MSHIITPTAINEAYESCRIRKHESRENAISVPGFMATSHAFSRKRLSSCAGFILGAIKKLPKTLRKSNGCTGQPWIIARRIVSQDKDYPLEVTDKLLSMAVALDYITATHPEGAVTDIFYIIIEDERCRKECMIQKDYRKAKWD